MTEASVHFGSKKIVFDVVRRPRSTLAISVSPDSRVSVVAPQKASIDQILAKVQKRAAWILKQKRFFLNVAPGPSTKRFVSGESLKYLGRQYRLKVVVGKNFGVKLKSGFIYVVIYGENPQNEVKAALARWYHSKAEMYFEKRLTLCLRRFLELKKTQPRLRIKEMLTRWGSCTKNGVILLNPELIHLPSHCIDYVICHELAHLKVRNHTPQFYKVLSKAMPDWELRRNRLMRYEL